MTIVYRTRPYWPYRAIKKHTGQIKPNNTIMDPKAYIRQPCKILEEHTGLNKTKQDYTGQHNTIHVKAKRVNDFVKE